MSLKYDVVVIGAGPAGSVAAEGFASRGFDVALLEKRQEVGCPVRCAEGVGKEVEEFIDPDPAFIRGEVDGAKIYSPDMTEIEMGPDVAGGEVGYVLERKIFDRELAENAGRAGADIYVKTLATGMERVDGEWRVAAKRSGEDLEFVAPLVIGADGVETYVGRWAGIDTVLPLRENMSCAQYLVTNLDYDHRYTHFYFGQDVAPGGYAWIFPKGEDRANVGLGVQPAMAEEKAITYLERFFDLDIFDGSRVVELMTGGVPVSGPLEEPYADGVLLVGDAAHFSDPVTGGGIINAMRSGRTAAEVGGEALEAGDVSEENLAVYGDRCMEEFGEKLEKHYMVKETLIKAEDATLDTMAGALRDADFDEFSVEELVTKMIQENPELLEFLDEAL